MGVDMEKVSQATPEHMKTVFVATAKQGGCIKRKSEVKNTFENTELTLTEPDWMKMGRELFVDCVEEAIVAVVCRCRRERVDDDGDELVCMDLREREGGLSEPSILFE